MKTVLAFVDSSAAARPVLQAAGALSSLMGAAVEAVHVVENGDDSAQAVSDSVGVPLHEVTGDTVERIVEMSAADDVVAVVVGARGRPTGARPAGHVALALANRTDTPVLVVPPDTPAPGSLDRVLVAMEGTRAQSRGLRKAMALADDAHLDLTVIHVDEEEAIPSFSDQVQHETDTYAHEFLARYLPGTHEARLEFRVGDPVREILDASDDIQPNVVAVGWPHSDDPGRGRVARELLDRSHLPVLLVALQQ